MARRAGSIGSETARDIRAAALRLFARHGYAAVSMRQIAAAVGIRAGALYNHFPTKQDILRELMVGHMEALIGAWERESFRFVDPVAALEGFVRFHIRYHLDKADAVFLAYMELRSLEPDNFRAVDRLRQYYEGCLRKILARGSADGAFTVADVPVGAMAIIAMLTGLNCWFRAGGRLGVDAIAEIYVRMALGSVGARLAAPA
ncbi:MAG: TetR family transcriptional regulator [Alphaproteobacteria bacterium]|nr:MAG: TetR family transcriptional regulator [Alphaproteobacteria bacterium]